MESSLLSQKDYQKRLRVQRSFTGPAGQEVVLEMHYPGWGKGKLHLKGFILSI